MLEKGRTKADLCVELELSLEQSELLEEKFFAWQVRRTVSKDEERASSPRTTSSSSARVDVNRGSRLIYDQDPEMLAWQARIDEENRWAEDNIVTSSCTTDGEGKPPPPSSDATEDSEEGPPSSRAA
jgi:hypothetical protein